MQSIVAGMSFSVSAQRSRIAFSTRTTPARESASATSGAEDWRSGVRSFRGSAMASEDTFARLVSLAVHDLRTPLATVFGFARTLARTDLGDPYERYVEMMVAACEQLADLLDEVGLAARIEAGRWEPNLQEVDSFELAAEVAGRLGTADVSGGGAPVRVDRDAAATALYQLARCALRHGGLERVEWRAAGGAVSIGPVTSGAAPILLGEEARDLGALIASRIVEALGGSTALDGDRLVVRLPS